MANGPSHKTTTSKIITLSKTIENSILYNESQMVYWSEWFLFFLNRAII